MAEELKRRTMRFSLDICALIQRLPDGEPGWTVKHQLAKSATSVAFNYRAACRGRSHAEYTAKIGLVSEESDETLGWLEFIEGARLLESPELGRLISEAGELSAIMSASYGTARYKERNKRQGRIAQFPYSQSITRLPDYPVPRLLRAAYPFSTGRAGSDDHSLHDPA